MKRFFIATVIIGMAICYREREFIKVYSQYQIEKMELKSIYSYSRDMEKANKFGANVSVLQWEQIRNDVRIQKDKIRELEYKLGYISGEKN